MKLASIVFKPVVWLAISLTLGLAPFKPEPHIWEKIKWIANDVGTMKAIDWFDFVLHGTPWVMLLLSIIYVIKNK